MGTSSVLTVKVRGLSHVRIVGDLARGNATSVTVEVTASVTLGTNMIALTVIALVL